MANFYNNPDTGGSAVAYAIYISGEQNLIENNQVSYSYDIDEAYGSIQFIWQVRQKRILF